MARRPAIKQDGDNPARLPPVLFSALNTTCRAVEDYSALTQDLRKVNNALHRLSQQDGLANRRGFDESLLQELVRVRRHHSPPGPADARHQLFQAAQ